MTKVCWSDEDTIRPRLPFNLEDEERHTIPNDVVKLSQYESWRDFAEGDYYDLTPPPDFVVVEKIE